MLVQKILKDFFPLILNDLLDILPASTSDLTLVTLWSNIQKGSHWSLGVWTLTLPEWFYDLSSSGTLISRWVIDLWPYLSDLLTRRLAVLSLVAGCVTFDG